MPALLWDCVNVSMPLARSTHSGALGIDSLPGRWLPALRRWIMGMCADRQKRYPKHLFGIPDLELSEDLCAEPSVGPWFRLGASSTGSGSDGQGVENVER